VSAGRSTPISSADAARPTVAVVGLGKIGLPLAAQYAGKGHTVIGCDLSPAVVASVNAGQSPVRGEAGLDDRVAEAVQKGRLRATTDTTAAVRESQVVVVIVPLYVDAQARVDYANLDAATAAVGKGLHPGTLVIYETTLPVGTTRSRLKAQLEQASGLQCGHDFFLAFSPERVYSGRIFQDLARYPKILGGVDDASTARAVAFYRSVLDAEVRPVANAETAEFTKLAETSYRDVNIALANELALYARRRGVDATQAFEAANTQPFSHIHRPSIGVGGHCIPVYPQFLIANGAADEVEMLRLARKTNDRMVEVAVDQLDEALGGLRGKRVLVLGLSYRENVKELAFSVAVRLIPALKAAGARVYANDPLFEPSEVDHLGVELVSDLAAPPAVDAIVIQAFHREYAQLDWARFRGLRAVFDGRGGLRPDALDGLDARYLSIPAPVA
jgi:nucleotide sugar dehydrogenase